MHRTWRADVHSDTLHTQKSFRNLIKSTQNQIVFAIFQLIWIKTDVRLDSNESENGKYNMILVWINKIPKSFLYVYTSVYFYLRIWLLTFGPLFILQSTILICPFLPHLKHVRDAVLFEETWITLSSLQLMFLEFSDSSKLLNALLNFTKFNSLSFYIIMIEKKL